MECGFENQYTSVGVLKVVICLFAVPEYLNVMFMFKFRFHYILPIQMHLSILVWYF